jgi:septal ring factor EnvC (AmiA/AmiB activator)
MLSLIKAILKILMICGTGLVLLQPAAVISEEYSASGKGVIVASSLNVRQGPGRNQRVIQILHKGDEVPVIAFHDEWVKIAVEENIGYIRNRDIYVRIIEPPATSGAKGKTEPPPAPSAEKEERTQHIKAVERKSRDIDRKIQKHKDQIQNFSQEEASIINGLDDLELALNRINAEIRKIRSDLAALDKKTRQITQESTELQQKIRTTEEYIARRIAALYKLNLVGPLHILASADSVYDLVYRKFAMERILEYDDAVLARHRENKDRLVAILRELDRQKAEKVALEGDLRKQIQIVSKKRALKKNLLADIRNKKSLESAAVDSLKQAAIALDQTILSLHVDPRIGADKPKSPFSTFKGLLKMPVKGKIISFFGPYKKGKYKVVTYRSGIEIKADRGEPIQAVHGGVVLYSGWFKNYGNMIIIDHGDHYYTLYAHAEELFKAKGDYVETDEVIATVGDTASMTGSNLYFEVRHRGEPLNPMKWLRGS